MQLVVGQQPDRAVAHDDELASETVGRLPAGRACACGSALATAIITSPDAIPEQTKRDLAPIIGKYVKKK